MIKDELNDSEKENAKQNGFLLTGKTGTGKTTLLNAFFGKEVGIAKICAKAVTKETKVYYYKLENGNCICLIDTPGLSDEETKLGNEKTDDEHLRGIKKAISEEKIHLKGILFLVNFQNERFDASEIDALINYNKIFPLKTFWKRIIIIYTHYYGDEDGESKEVIKEYRDATNSEIFTKIMEKVKKVSDVIPYKDLKIRYFNLASKPKTEKQKKNNIKYRDELEILLDELSKNTPLFHRIEIQQIQNYKLKEDDIEYNAEVQIIQYINLNEKPIGQAIDVISKKKIVKNDDCPPTSCNTYICKGSRANDGTLEHTVEKKEKFFNFELPPIDPKEIAMGVGRSAMGLGGNMGILAAATAASIAVPVLTPVIAIAGVASSVGLGFFIKKLFGY